MPWRAASPRDRKSTRLNSSHVSISYAVFCLKKKNHHVGQFQQLLIAKQAPSGSHGHKRICSYRCGPARRNRAQSTAGIVEVDSILAPVVTIGDQLELLASEGMVRVDYFKSGIGMVAMRRR